MNEIEKARKTEEQLIKVINESWLPLTTIHYMLSNIQRQIVEVMNQPSEEQPEKPEDSAYGERPDPEPGTAAGRTER